MGQKDIGTQPFLQNIFTLFSKIPFLTLWLFEKCICCTIEKFICRTMKKGIVRLMAGRILRILQVCYEAIH